MSEWNVIHENFHTKYSVLPAPDEHMPYIIQLHIMSKHTQRETETETERQTERQTDRERQRQRGLCFEQQRSPYLQGGSTPCPGRPAHHPMEGEGVAGRKYACCLNGWMIRNLGLIRSRHVACSRGQADSRRLFCCRLVRSLHCRHRCVPKEIGRNVVCVIV